MKHTSAHLHAARPGCALLPVSPKNLFRARCVQPSVCGGGALPSPMAFQAILAARERRKMAAAVAAGFLSDEKWGGMDGLSVEQILKCNEKRLIELFELWDEDGSGSIDAQELRQRRSKCSLSVAQRDGWHGCLHVGP